MWLYASFIDFVNWISLFYLYAIYNCLALIHFQSHIHFWHTWISAIKTIEKEENSRVQPNVYYWMKFL